MPTVGDEDATDARDPGGEVNHLDHEDATDARDPGGEVNHLDHEDATRGGQGLDDSESPTTAAVSAPEPGGRQPGLDDPPQTGHAEVDAALADVGDVSGVDPVVAHERLARAHEALHGLLEGRDRS